MGWFKSTEEKIEELKRMWEQAVEEGDERGAAYIDYEIKRVSRKDGNSDER